MKERCKAIAMYLLKKKCLLKTSKATWMNFKDTVLSEINMCYRLNVCVLCPIVHVEI